MTPSLEGWPIRAKEVPSLHEVKLTLLGTIPVYIRKSLLKNIYKKSLRQENNFVNEDSIPTIWLHLPYIRHKGNIK